MAQNTDFEHLAVYYAKYLLPSPNLQPHQKFKLTGFYKSHIRFHHLQKRSKNLGCMPWSLVRF